MHTSLLLDQDQNSKTFVKINPLNFSNFQLSDKKTLNAISEIQTERAPGSLIKYWFTFSDGSVELLEPNLFYCLEYLNLTKDVILPKNPKIYDWVVLFYDQVEMALSIDYGNNDHLKIYGNGKRIMGFDESLICNMQFSHLKLMFIDDMNGWIIV